MKTRFRNGSKPVSGPSRLLRERHLGPGDTATDLAREDLLGGQLAGYFKQRTADIGINVDVTDVADALELLDQSGETEQR